MSAYIRLFIVATAIVAQAGCAVVPKPDIENGKTTFNAMCAVCHSVQKTGGPTQGPNLLGIVGRKAASEPDFTMYTPALKASNITWTAKNLDSFLLNPMVKVPNTAMPMLIADDKTRADVIAYLETLKK
jgi:cytochrome c